MSRSLFGVVAAVLVALVLLLGGVTKVARMGEWRSQSDGIGVPWALALFVPFAEIGLGAMLLVQLQRHVVAWFAVALFTAFTALLLLRLSQSRRPPCACFGSLSSKPIGPGHIARNLVLIAIALAAAML